MHNNYVIMTDSACDINPELLKEWGVSQLELSFILDGGEKELFGADMPVVAFYNKMREGSVAKTSAINPDRFLAAFEPILKEGKDILYLGFSSGLSVTYHSSTIAAEQLLEAYPDRKLITVDTLCASAGQGLFVKLAVDKKNAGASMEEVAAYMEEIRLNLCHWFTVDDLVYLKRGGRISPTVAFVGNVLGIKPVLHMDDEGHLQNVSKARGRKGAIKALVQQYRELALTPGEGIVYISHGDCIDDAKYLAALLQEEFGVQVQVIADIGPVIGAHSGPGTLALFFLGKNR